RPPPGPASRQSVIGMVQNGSVPNAEPATHPIEGAEEIMAADNHTTIAGNLVETPERRLTTTGTPVTNLRVAVTQRIQQDGEWRDGETSFFKVNVWRGQAEHLADSLAKGDRVMVTGRLRQRSWETPEGEKRSVAEIEADEVGASLKFATAKVERAQERAAGDRNQARERQGERGGDFNDQPPFGPAPLPAPSALAGGADLPSGYGQGCSIRDPPVAWTSTSGQPPPLRRLHLPIWLRVPKRRCAIPPVHPDPRPSDYETDARRRSGRLQTDLACSRWMARRSRRLQTATEGPAGCSTGLL